MMFQRVIGQTKRAAAVLIAASLLGLPSGDAADPSDYLSTAPTHRIFNGGMPPGVIAATRAAMSHQVQPPYYQPVQFQGPRGVEFSMSQYGSFDEGDPNLMAGLLVGQVYRFRVTNIPRNPGTELYPTIEMVDRTYPPPGLATRFPIPITLDEEDLEAAMRGRLVTRVIYLEDPQTATPLTQPETGPVPFDVPEYQDPLVMADLRGRTVAILRIGSLVPPREPELHPQFFFGYPSWAPIFQPDAQTEPQPEVTPQVTPQPQPPAMQANE